jgi:hypothetical protein
MTKLRPVFEGALCLGAALAVMGGALIGVLTLIDPDIRYLRALEAGYRHILFGFLFCTLFSVAAALLEALARGREPREEAPSRPASAATPPDAAVPAGRPSSTPELAALYHEMKTYVDLEMWELALEKAGAIVKGFPGTREADIVSRILGEIRWKAEPKFLAQQAPLTADQEKDLREKGLAEMYRHVQTYMDLEMWELARQKALAIMKSFPESPEAIRLMKIFDSLEKKAQAAPAAPSTPDKIDEPGFPAD